MSHEPTAFKRYLAFAFRQFYPQGGWDDFVGTFDTADEAKSAVEKHHTENDHDREYWRGNIFDALEGRVTFCLYDNGWCDPGSIDAP